ncbi:dehydrogenase [Photorhabdus laumondii subsp. laumondii]|uniref:WblW protein n=2 Tax=Photorhabdus laumondii subsp. laumondii TaxID=141679 RepID=Q7MY66_PHOLL|nr:MULTISPECIES: dehydrogenase [Photorhabdus]AWK44318.1 dehydrogenase [Photorhabdus laumondii subsp. laumondii]AXG45048.1 dehydrogenase [Photorhabdus laumondii subsp. laumondii]AXG49631.1 dehydrogenase [Photorhabdus laumondii subsp. laumondii]MCC8386129.1 dehydrogenase [Photorhabdus laumondii]MCC8390605.1 dehydrogenase [Photorhabdus laumondii]
MKIRSRAPLRLGIAGGGTDVSPYSDEFGGCVLNATINMYAHAFIDDDIKGNQVIFEAKDLGIIDIIELDNDVSLDGNLVLHRAVYKRIMEQYNKGKYIPLRLTTQSDAPPGSGLGSSSTMVVAMLEGFRQLLSLPLGEYDIAQLAYEIERRDCKLSGGKQDQYAATFGGFNFIEFYANDRVIVNPLRMRRYIISELESSLILFFTGTSRDSAKIIDDQIKSIKKDNGARLDAMHKVKESAYKIKELLFKADILGVAQEFRNAWESKKATSPSISNALIDAVESSILNAGAISMKISGAGGGGFMMIFVEPENKLDVIKALEQFDGHVHKFQFTNEGAYSWTI